MSIPITGAFEPDVHGIVRRLGALRTTHGRVGACDPLTSRLDCERPFVATLPPGEHPVDVLLAGDEARAEVALARVAVRGRDAVTYELATRAGEDMRTLGPGHLFTYAVDAGTGCFFDPDAAGTLSTATHAEAWLAQLAANRRPDWTFASADVGAEVSAAVMFSSGGGDGSYATWLGRDASGAPACFVTDFGLLDLELPSIPDDPAFRSTYVDAQVAKLYALVPALDGSEAAAAWEVEADIASLAPDAIGHLPEFLRRLRTAEAGPSSDPRAALLFTRLVKDLLGYAEVQSALVPELPSLSDDLLPRILPARPRTVSPSLAEALADRLAQGSSALRASILPIQYGVNPRTGIALAAAVIEKEGSGAAFDQALSFLQRIRSEADVPEPESLRRRIGDLQASTTDETRRAILSRILAKLGGPTGRGT